MKRTHSFLSAALMVGMLYAAGVQAESSERSISGARDVQATSVGLKSLVTSLNSKVASANTLVDKLNQRMDLYDQWINNLSAIYGDNTTRLDAADRTFEDLNRQLRELNDRLLAVAEEQEWQDDMTAAILDCSGQEKFYSIAVDQCVREGKYGPSRTKKAVTKTFNINQECGGQKCYYSPATARKLCDREDFTHVKNVQTTFSTTSCGSSNFYKRWSTKKDEWDGVTVTLARFADRGGCMGSAQTVPVVTAVTCLKYVYVSD